MSLGSLRESQGRANLGPAGEEGRWEGKEWAGAGQWELDCREGEREREREREGEEDHAGPTLTLGLH
jgi:hypothetical protein